MANKQVKFIEEFPLNPKDILSSFDVFGMSSMEFGIYCKILFVSWIQKPRQCFLEFDEHNICELCNITPEDWAKCQLKVLKKFKQKIEVDKIYIYNQVLLDKWAEAATHNKSSKGKQLSALAEMLVYPFEQFWSDYDKKVGDKNRILPKYLKLSDLDREIIRLDIPKRKAATSDPKKYMPKPEKYINERVFEDEIIDYKNKYEQGNTKSKQQGSYNADGLSSLNNAITGVQKE